MKFYKRMLFSFLCVFLFFSALIGVETPIVPKESQINDDEVKLTLARIYSHERNNYEKALIYYNELLQNDSKQVDLYLEIGQVLLNLKQYQKGLNQLYQGLNIEPNNIKLLIATAQGEANSGHALKARYLFEKATQIEPYKKSIQIDYADAMMSWGDFSKSASIFREALKEEKNNIDLWLKLALSLVSMERYEEAESIYLTLLKNHPENSKVFEARINLKFQEKKYCEALEIVEEALSLNLKGQFHLLKANIFFQIGDFEEAIKYYHISKIDTNVATQSWIGIGKSYIKIENLFRANEAFNHALSIDPKNVQAKYYLGQNFIDYSPIELNEIASIKLENGLLAEALFIYQIILEKDIEYFPAQFGQAEMFGILYFYCDALLIYEELLDQFPNDIKIMLAIARTLAWSKQYAASLAYYDRLIELNPCNPMLYREKARTALWGQNKQLSFATYDALISDSNCCSWDSYALDSIKISFFLERKAKKYIWDKYYIHSLNAYKNLIGFSPGNEEALFEYAQSFCILGLCDRSKQIYEEILKIDPNHTLVQKAQYRNEMHTHNAIIQNISYWREIGSGTFSQSQIARYRTDTIWEIPLTCRSRFRLSQQFYVENPFYNFQFYPAQGQTLETDCIFNEFVSANISATYKTYFREFEPTFTSRNWISFNFFDYFQATLGCNKEDEIYNYFSLEQGTQSINTWITILSNITRYWSIGGTYQWYFYNDNNKQIHLNLISEYQLTNDPNILKLIIQGNYRNASHQSISIVNGINLIDVIYPYWTPDNYYSASATIEFRKDYRQIAYCEGPQRYLDLKITGEIDSVNNPSLEGIVEWKHDFNCHWGINLKALIHRSKEWNAEGAWATISYVF